METSNLTKQQFPTKLQTILEDPNFGNAIRLNPHKFEIQILNQKEFSTAVLPLFFRHANITSFYRQLNIYGFKKMRKQPRHCFYHPHLEKGKKVGQLLSKKQSLKRKIKQRRQMNLNKRKQKVEQIQNPIQQNYQEAQIRQQENILSNHVQACEISFPQVQHNITYMQIFYGWPYWTAAGFYSYM